MKKSVDIELCCECGKEAPTANRPMCASCKDAGRRAVFCRYGSECINTHGKSAHAAKKAWRVMTENVSVPGSRSGHDVLGGLVPVEAQRSGPLAAPVFAEGPSAEEQFADMALGLADQIKGVAAQMNDGKVAIGGAITTLEQVFAEFFSHVHSLAEAVKTGATRA